MLIDADLHRLPVTLLGTGPSLAYSALGPTHCSIDDFGLLRTVPGMLVLAPSCMAAANVLLEEGLTQGRLMYLRVPRATRARAKFERRCMNHVAGLRVRPPYVGSRFAGGLSR